MARRSLRASDFVGAAAEDDGVGFGDAACARPPAIPRLIRAAAVPAPIVLTAIAANGFIRVSLFVVDVHPEGSTLTLTRGCQTLVGPQSVFCKRRRTGKEEWHWPGWRQKCESCPGIGTSGSKRAEN